LLESLSRHAEARDQFERSVAIAREMFEVKGDQTAGYGLHRQLWFLSEYEMELGNVDTAVRLRAEVFELIGIKVDDDLQLTSSMDEVLVVCDQ
jgi:hypothetical protein